MDSFQVFNLNAIVIPIITIKRSTIFDFQSIFKFSLIFFYFANKVVLINKKKYFDELDQYQSDRKETFSMNDHIIFTKRVYPL